MPTVNKFLSTKYPLIAAPMAGGPSSCELVAAVTAAGAFGFLAAGYLTPQALDERISTVKAAVGEQPFGVNVFVPSSPTMSPEAAAHACQAYAAHIRSDVESVGATLPEELRLEDRDWFEEKIEVLENNPVPVVSFTFGLPDGVTMERIARTGARILLTVTSIEEALEAAALCPDGLIVQGPAAGGHSATFNPASEVLHAATVADTAERVRQVKAATQENVSRLGAPLVYVAAGGVDGPDSVRLLLDAGADAVAAGTLFLGASEAGTSELHRRALCEHQFSETIVTRAFTGRPARALANGFAKRHSAQAPACYPAVHYLTTGMRKLAASQNKVDLVHLWAGSGFSAVRQDSAASLVEWLTSKL